MDGTVHSQHSDSHESGDDDVDHVVSTPEDDEPVHVSLDVASHEVIQSDEAAGPSQASLVSAVSVFAADPVTTTSPRPSLPTLFCPASSPSVRHDTPNRTEPSALTAPVFSRAQKDADDPTSPVDRRRPEPMTLTALTRLFTAQTSPVASRTPSYNHAANPLVPAGMSFAGPVPRY